MAKTLRKPCTLVFIMYFLRFLHSLENRELFLNETLLLCKNAKICGRQYTNETIDENFLEYRSCCRDCSCEESCETDDNCCYPKPDKRFLENYQECIVPFTKDLQIDEKYKYTFYRMVSSCPLKADTLKATMESQQDCGNAKVAPWGSLFPVYSEQTGKIYKNSECAKCHGVLKFTEWEIYVDCRMVDDVYIVSNLEWLYRTDWHKPSNCELLFKFPLPTTLISTLQCVTDIINTCNVTTISVPDDFPMTSEEIINACLFGPKTAFTVHRAYTNVFCYLCNVGDFQSVDYCIRSSGETMTLFPWSFTVVIDQNLEFGVKQNAQVTLKTPPVACIMEGNIPTNTCAPRYCPTGQIFNANFQCTNPARYWNVQSYHVNVGLHPLSNLSVVVMNKLMEDYDNGLKEWLSIPWPSFWKLNDLHYKTNDGEFVERVVVVLLLDTTFKYKHSKVLLMIKQFISKQWQITADNESVVLSSDFLEYSALMLPRSDPFSLSSQWFMRPGPALLDRYGKITKLFFCEQVSLGENGTPALFELLSDKMFLRYHGRTYNNGEFEFSFNKQGETEVRICIDDSPYVAMTQANECCKHYSSWLASVLLITIPMLWFSA